MLKGTAEAFEMSLEEDPNETTKAFGVVEIYNAAYICHMKEFMRTPIAK